MSETEEQASEQSAGLSLTRVGLGFAALAALIGLGSLVGGYVEPFREWIDGLGAAGPIVFTLVYALCVVAFVPGAALTIAGGLAFGVATGSLLVFVAATIGAIGAFLIARYVARDAIEARIQANPRFAAIDRAIEGQGRKIVFLLRLSPVFPFNLLNYGLGLTKVRLLDYAIASVGMIPGTILYVYIGSLGGELAAASSGGAEWGEIALFAVGLVATLVVTVLITRIARRALDEAANLEATVEATEEA